MIFVGYSSSLTLVLLSGLAFYFPLDVVLILSKTRFSLNCFSASISYGYHRDNTEGHKWTKKLTNKL